MPAPPECHLNERGELPTCYIKALNFNAGWLIGINKNKNHRPKSVMKPKTADCLKTNTVTVQRI